MLERKKLKCFIRKGMFSTERTIQFRLRNGEDYWEWVPRTDVIGELESDGYVLVDSYQDQGASWAVIPNEYRDNFPVPDADLVPLESAELVLH